MVQGVTSGTYNFSGRLSNADIVLDAFERCGLAPATLTQQQMTSARRSLNLELQSWGNNGPNLWLVDTISFPLTQGVTEYSIPNNTVGVLDVYIRQYLSLQTENLALGLSTTTGSNLVTVYQANHGFTGGEYLNFVNQVSVGGIVLYGYYLVGTVINTNQFTVAALAEATSTVNNGGATALFTTINTQSNITVTLNNHGLSTGAQFNVPIAVTVGGITLSGLYTVASITDANNFVINAGQSATSSSAVYSNNNQVQIIEQVPNSQPTDRIMMSISRTEYDMLPNKNQQGFPNQFWYDRLVNPAMYIWQVPDSTGPYVLFVSRLRQAQDANLGSGEIPEVQFLALDALTAKLAVRLAIKFAPDRVQMLKSEAVEAWNMFAEENREKVPLRIYPSIGRYFGGGL